MESHWPSDLPLSKASHTSFVNSSISKNDIAQWARGFRGSCRIFQRWVNHTHSILGATMPHEWSECTVSKRATLSIRRRQIRVELLDFPSKELGKPA